MRIAISSNGVTLPLAGEDGISEREHTSVSGFVLEGSSSRRVINRVRSEYAIPVDDGNLLTLITFDTSLVFSTPQVAANFCRDLDAEFPRSGNLIFDTGDETRKLTHAVVSPPQRQLSGCRVDLSYRVNGSEIQLNEPEIIPEMPDLVQLEYRMVSDAAGHWFEMGFNVFEELAGSPSAGWTLPSLPGLKMQLQRSTDLVTWHEDELEDCAGSPTELIDGSWEYWVRGSVPSNWKEVLLDFTATTTRYGKSITAIQLKSAAVSLPNFPYAMPSQAATLQADLRAAGFTGATVTTSSAAITATAKNHTVGGTIVLGVTMSGVNVTAVSYQGSTITSGMSYPYAMPAARATLQTHLRAAGYSGAVVMLYDDPWEIILPDVDAVDKVRDFILTITPGDPYPAWNMFGDYLGESPGATIVGSSGNVRDPSGNPLAEAIKQFFRMKVNVP